jgi:polysaccharide biosynthesis/export protein
VFTANDKEFVMKGLLRLLPIVLASTLVGCAGPDITVPPLTAEDLVRMASLANFPHEIYRIEAGDTLQIRYIYHPEMKQDDVIVRPDGKITAQLVGEIVVAGMTTAEVGRALAERTATQLRSPEVVVSISRFSEKQVYVGGEVGKPGTIIYRKGLTPLQAITASGGFRETARLDSVILVRTGGSDNNFISRKLDLKEVIGSGIKEPVYLAPHDVIFVPRTPIAEADLWVKQHITDLFPLIRGSALPAVPVP